jgi:hypothetical protein
MRGATTTKTKGEVMAKQPQQRTVFCNGIAWSVANTIETAVGAMTPFDRKRFLSKVMRKVQELQKRESEHHEWGNQRSMLPARQSRRQS